MKKSKKISFLIIAFATFTIGNIAAQGTIILVKGAACAGKTTLINDLLKENPELRYISEDEHCMDSFAEFVQTQFAKKYQIATAAINPKNLFHAITRNQILFKPESSDDAKQQATAAVNKIRAKLEDIKIPYLDLRETYRETYNKMLKQRINASLNTYLEANKCILFDGWLITPEEVDALRSRARIVTVFVHCPFDTLLQRFVQRNELQQKDYRERRFYSQLLNSFKRYYRNTPNRDIALDYVEKDQLRFALEKIRSTLLPTSPEPRQGEFSRREFTQEEFDIYTKELLIKLGLARSSDGFICPDLSYDYLMMNTSHPFAKSKIERELLDLIVSNRWINK